MNKFLTLLATTTALAVAAPAMAAETSVKAESSMQAKDHGGYEKKALSEKVNAAGTKSTADTQVELDVDSDGDATKTVVTKETRDPKGLFNKDTVKSKTTEKMKDGKLSVEHEKSVNGKTVVERKASY